MLMIARSLLVLCALLAHAAQAKGETPAQANADLQVKGKLVTIHVRDQDPFELARRLQEQSSLRLENMEVLKGTPAIGFQFEEIPLLTVLDLLAMNAEVWLHCEAGRLCRFGTHEERRRGKAVYEAWKQALMQNAPDLRSREEAWVAFLRPPEHGPAQLYLDDWNELVIAARAQGDSERASRYLAIKVEHAKRLHGENSGPYGLAIAAQAQAGYEASKDPSLLKAMERGLALGEAEFGKVSGALAETQLALADAYTDLSRWAEAEEMYRRAIEGLGTPEPDSREPHILAPAVSKLAFLLDRQDRWAEAIPLYERSISLHHANSSDRSLAALDGERLGGDLYRLGRFPEATRAFKDVAKIRPLRDQPKLQLQVMELLGDVLSETAPGDALERMRGRAAANKDKALEMEGLFFLQEYSRTQFKEAPRSEAWQRTCAAFGVLLASSAEGSGAYPEKRRTGDAQCRRKARMAGPAQSS